MSDAENADTGFCERGCTERMQRRFGDFHQEIDATGRNERAYREHLELPLINVKECLRRAIP